MIADRCGALTTSRPLPGGGGAVLAPAASAAEALGSCRPLSDGGRLPARMCVVISRGACRSDDTAQRE
jgi:hypothetical protein